MRRNAITLDLELCAGRGWRVLVVAAFAALLLSGAVPSLARAQESLELPPQYLENLQAYLASPKAGRDVSVSISPEELGLDPRGEVEAVPFAPASLPLFSAQSLSTPAQSPTYDFALQFASINGNIPTVPDCDRIW